MQRRQLTNVPPSSDLVLVSVKRGISEIYRPDPLLAKGRPWSRGG